MGLRIVKESQISAELDETIRDGLCICFPKDRAVYSQTRDWHGSKPAWSVFIEDDDRIIAHTSIVDRTILAGCESVRVAGVENVYVLPEYRGKGFSGQVLEAAMAEAKRLDYDLGLLFCVSGIEKIYSRCGWQRLPTRPIIRIDQKGFEAPIPEGNIAMFYPLRKNEFPDGTIHLQGNDW